MFTNASEAGSHSFYSRILSSQFNDIEELQFRLRSYFQRRLDECDNEIIPETNMNPNFLHEKDMKFNLYPLYINWKKIEKNDDEYYFSLSKFGFFGASIYSNFKPSYPGLELKNIFFIFASFIYEFLNNKKEILKKVKEFLMQLPDLKIIFSLIKNKIIMFKEIPMILMVLKMYEIYYIKNKNKDVINEILKHEFLLINYLSNEEYTQVFSENYAGRVNNVFKNITKTHGKIYALSSTKDSFINHLKFVFQSCNKDNKEKMNHSF